MALMKNRQSKKITPEELNSYSMKLKPECEKIVSELDYGLVAVDFIREIGENYLRITISHKDRVTNLEDCEKVSRKVDKYLDEKDPIPFPYILEVQSPSISAETAKDVWKNHNFEVKGLGLVVGG